MFLHIRSEVAFGAKPFFGFYVESRYLLGRRRQGVTETCCHTFSHELRHNYHSSRRIHPYRVSVRVVGARSVYSFITDILIVLLISLFSSSSSGVN